MPLLRPALFDDDADTELCRSLMREYAAHLNAAAGGEHICVASLEKELAALPGPYASPAGAVLLVFSQGQPAGCVALRPVITADHERLCEMKRLWVRPAFHGSGLGRKLAQAALDTARERGYSAVVLDTIPEQMQAAWRIYRALGFTPTECGDHAAVRPDEHGKIVCMRREL